MEPLITVRNLAVVRGPNAEEPFHLEVPDLSVPRGLFTTILGESGCGKTTLLLILGLLRVPDSEFVVTCEDLSFHLTDPPPGWVVGRYRIYRDRTLTQDGEALSAELREHLRRDFIGFCLQGGELLPSLSLVDNVAVPRQIGKQDRAIESARTWLHSLGMDDEDRSYAGRLPRGLSGGQKQRGVFARALVHDPGLIILDEPTSQLDRQTAQEAIRILKDEAFRQGQTVVMVTHDQVLAETFSDLIVKMEATDKGRGTVTGTYWTDALPQPEPALLQSSDANESNADTSREFQIPPLEDVNQLPSPGHEVGWRYFARLGLQDALGPIFGMIQDSLGLRPKALRRIRRDKTSAFLWQVFRNSLIIVAVGLFILLLRGMRAGLLEDFRENLTRSPTARQLRITPHLRTGSLTDADLQRLMAENPELEMVIPEITHVVTLAKESRSVEAVDLVATLPADPLLSVVYPDQDFSDFDLNAIVLPDTLARQLDVAVGDELTVSTSRVLDREGRVKEEASLEIRVSNILPDGKAGRGFVDVELARQISAFKAGQPVPERDWAGRPHAVDPRYPAFYLFAKYDLLPRERSVLESRGLVLEEVEAAEILEAFGGLITPEPTGEPGSRPPSLKVHKLLSGRQEGDFKWLDATLLESERFLTDCDGIILPWSPPLRARLDGDEVQLVGLSGRLRWLDSYVTRSKAVFPRGAIDWRVALEDRRESSSACRLRITADGISLDLPVLADISAHQGSAVTTPTAVVPAAFLAQVDMAARGLAEPDPDLRVFRDIGGELHYRRARVFAGDIYQVVSLHDRLVGDFGVTSQRAQVREVQSYRSILDYLVRVLSIISVVIAFVTVWIVFQDVSERKMRSTATLRIMGLPQRGVVGVLMTQGMLVAFFASLLLVVLGFGAQIAVNLIVGNEACVLTVEDYAMVVAAVFGVCIVGTWFPARTASGVDPIVALERAEQHV